MFVFGKCNEYPLFSTAGRIDDAQVVILPIVDFLKPKPDYLPIAIPADIADRLEKVHGEPHIWWVGQFMKYLLRMQPDYQTMIDGYVSKLGITSPTVGYAPISLINNVHIYF